MGYPLKEMKPRHKEIARRIVTGQTLESISKELHVSYGHLINLQKDPIFHAGYLEIEAEAHQIWLHARKTAMEVLDDTALKSAELCAEAVDGLVKTPVVDDQGNVELQFEKVPLGKRLDSAWDVLNRTGNKVIDKPPEAVISIQQLIIQAYAERNERKGLPEAQRPLIPSEDSTVDPNTGSTVLQLEAPEG